MNGKRSDNQLYLAFAAEPASEARPLAAQEVESLTVTDETERPVDPVMITMEAICKSENVRQAFWQVRANKGSAGVDGMTVHQLQEYLQDHLSDIQQQLLNGTYKPMPVRRVEIPKPDGGIRKLGIPTVVDRLIQQAILQVLTWEWEPTFSTHSY